MNLPFANEPEFCGTVNIASSVRFGKRCTVWQFASICHDVVIGDDVVVGSNVWIGAGTVIGNGTRIQHGAFIPKNTKIGASVFIGPNVTMTDDKYPNVNKTTPYRAQPPVLEDMCALGAGCVILPGVKVKHGALVGAGAVVTKDVEEYKTVVGIPAASQT